MDMSVVEGGEKPVDANEVQEYAAEIHTYLRDVEVRNGVKCSTLYIRLNNSFSRVFKVLIYLSRGRSRNAHNYLKCMDFACKWIS